MKVFIFSTRNARDISETERFWISYQVLRGLDDIHEKNLYHGNLNPETIYVLESGWVKITDFDNSGFQKSATVQSPDIVQGKHDFKAEDIKSLGLYHQ